MNVPELVEYWKDLRLNVLQLGDIQKEHILMNDLKLVRHTYGTICCNLLSCMADERSSRTRPL